MKHKPVDIIKLMIFNTGAINFPGTGRLCKDIEPNFYAVTYGRASPGFSLFDLITRIKWHITDTLHDDMKKETNNE